MRRCVERKDAMDGELKLFLDADGCSACAACCEDQEDMRIMQAHARIEVCGSPGANDSKRCGIMSLLRVVTCERGRSK